MPSKGASRLDVVPHIPGGPHLILLSTALSTPPDIDLELRSSSRRIRPRVTHSVLFALHLLQAMGTVRITLIFWSS